MNAFSKLKQSVDDHGVSGTLLKALNRTSWLLRLPMLGRKLRTLGDQRFDRQYGVDTAGIVEVADLGIDQSLEKASLHYEATPVKALRAMLGLLDVDHSKYTFIDFGSGKGRVLLLASEYSYQRIIGVEFAETLHLIAQQNIARWTSATKRCFKLGSVCMDAGEFALPDEPLIIFLFTPFRSPVSDRVVRRIQESITKSPRPVKILYYGSNTAFINLLDTLNFRRTEIYTKRPFAAQAGYKGLLFSST
jgi:hypothetical protein